MRIQTYPKRMIQHACYPALSKLGLMILFLLCTFGCEMPTKFTTHQEYVEKTEWSHEKGIVKSPKAKWSIEWEL